MVLMQFLALLRPVDTANRMHFPMVLALWQVLGAISSISSQNSQLDDDAKDQVLESYCCFGLTVLI